MQRRKLLRRTGKRRLRLGSWSVARARDFISHYGTDISANQLREGRKADLDNHVEAINAFIRKADGEVGASSSEDDEVKEEAWHGIAEPVDIDHEAEYEDEDRHTTVTIETVDITRDGFQKVADANTSGGDEDDEPQAEGAQAITGTTNEGKPVKGKRIWTKERPEGPKKKKKKFRYESKAERKLTRYKERSKNKAQAKSRKE